LEVQGLDVTARQRLRLTGFAVIAQQRLRLLGYVLDPDWASDTLRNV
jgi:hypothetical protein